MNKRVVVFAGLLMTAGLASGAVVDSLLADYSKMSGKEPVVERGQNAWSLVVNTAGSTQGRSCTSCHGADLTLPGKHQRTGKSIEPMALSVNSVRFQDAAKIEKWFKRNCKWTWGRECTPQEKGDFLLFLQGQ